MGESFESLTIRIGANTTQLENALKNVKHASTQAQEQLKILSKALRFDGSNVEATAKHLANLKNQSEITAKQLSLVRTTINQYNGTKIAELASEWKNVAAEAYKVKETYETTHNKLAALKDKLMEIAEANGYSFDRDDLYQYLGELSKIDSKTEKLCTDYKKLSATYKDIEDQWRRAKEVMRLDNAINEAIRLEAELRDMSARIADIENKTFLRKMIPQLEQAEAKTQIFSEELKRVDLALRQVDESLKLNPKNVELLTDKANLFYQKIQLTRRQTDELEGTLRKLEASGINAAAEDMTELRLKAAASKKEFVDIDAKLKLLKADTEGETEEIRELEVAAEKARIEMSKDNARLEYAKTKSQVDKLKTSLVEMTNAGQRSNLGLFNSIRDISTTLAATVTPLALTGLYRLVSSAEAIDSAYRDMRKTVEGTEEQFESLRQSAIEMSKTSIVSADQILEIEAMGGQLGLAVEKLESFARVSSNLDIASDLDSETIATQLGQLNNLLEWDELRFNDGREAMERYGDSLVRLGNNMPTTESKISGVTTAIGAAAHQFGMSTPEILAWSSAIAATGQGTESSGTAISNTMYDIEAAVNGTTDKATAQLKLFADTAGMSADEFADAWNNNASYAMKRFVEGLRSLEENGESASNRLSELGINGVRQRRALLGLAQTVDNLDDALQMSEHAWSGISDQWGKAGDAANEADKKMQGFSGLVGILKNNAAALGDTIGESLVPLLQFAVDSFQSFNEIIAAIPTPILSVLTTITALIAAFAPVGRIAGQAAVTFEQFQRAITKSRTATLLQAAAQKTLTEAETAEIMKLKEARVVREADTAATEENTAATEANSAAEKKNASATNTSTVAEKKATAQTKAATTATKAKVAAMAAARIAAAALAIEGIIILAEALGDLAERQRNITMATKQLESSFNAAVISTATNTDSIKLLGKAAEYVVPKFDELAEKQAQVSGAIIETNSKMIENVTMMEAYAEAVGNLTDRSDLSAEEIANLRIAVDGLAGATGEALTVEMDEDGVWRVMTDDGALLNEEVQKLVENKKTLMQLDAASDNAVAAYKAEQEAAMALGKVQSQLADAEAQANKEREEQGFVSEETAAKVAVLQTQVEQYSSTAESAAKASEFFKDQQVLLQMVADGSASSLQNYIAQHFELQGAIQGAGIDMSDFIKYLEDTGKSVDDLTTENFPNLVKEFQISTGQIEEEAAELEYELVETTRKAVLRSAEEVRKESPELIAEAQKACGLTEDEFFELALQCGVDSKEAIARFCEGLKNGETPARIQALAVATAAEDPLKNMKSYTWGVDLGVNFAKGLAASRSFVEGAVSGLMTATAAMQFSVPSEGMWSGAEKGGERSGQHLVENFIEGMKARENALREEALRLGSILYDAINGYDYASVSNRAYDASTAAVNAAAEYRSVAVSTQARKSTTQNVVHETKYVLSGDINITAKTDDPDEIIDAILDRFEIAQSVY